jgi:hypothetical protein
MSGDTADAGSPLFDQLVEASGLAAVVAPFTVSRLLVRADVRPETLTPQELTRALPELESGIAVYLRGDELDRALSAVRALAA